MNKIRNTYQIQVVDALAENCRKILDNPNTVLDIGTWLTISCVISSDVVVVKSFVIFDTIL